MKGLKITSDISRILPTKKFEEGSTISVDVPRDSVYKHLLLTLSGSVITTYGAGTPVSDDTATMNRLINSIDIISNGSFTIKSVTPWMMHIQQFMATSIFGVRRSVVGATAVDTPNEDGAFSYGTTGQYTSVAESIFISFENVLAGKGRMNTLWDTRGLASAEIKISTASFKNLQSSANYATAPVVYSSSTLEIQIETVETQNVPLNVFFSAWKQTTKQVAFTAQTNDFLLDVNRGNFLQGIMFETRNGDTDRLLSNDVLGTIKLIINGTNYLQNTTFKSLQAKNISRFGLNTPFVGGKSLIDGMCYMDLLTPAGGEKFGNLATAQNVQAPMVDQVQLSLSTANADFTNTVVTRILTNEIVQPVSAS